MRHRRTTPRHRRTARCRAAARRVLYPEGQLHVADHRRHRSRARAIAAARRRRGTCSPRSATRSPRRPASSTCFDGPAATSAPTPTSPTRSPTSRRQRRGHHAVRAGQPRGAPAAGRPPTCSPAPIAARSRARRDRAALRRRAARHQRRPVRSHGRCVRRRSVDDRRRSRARTVRSRSCRRFPPCTATPSTRAHPAVQSRDPRDRAGPLATADRLSPRARGAARRRHRRRRHPSHRGARGRLRADRHGLGYGYNLRNLLSLEALDRARRARNGEALDASAPRRAGSGSHGDPFRGQLPLGRPGRHPRRRGRRSRLPAAGSTTTGREIVYRLDLPAYDHDRRVRDRPRAGRRRRRDPRRHARPAHASRRRSPRRRPRSGPARCSSSSIAGRRVAKASSRSRSRRADGHAPSSQLGVNEARHHRRQRVSRTCVVELARRLAAERTDERVLGERVAVRRRHRGQQRDLDVVDQRAVGLGRQRARDLVRRRSRGRGPGARTRRSPPAARWRAASAAAAGAPDPRSVRNSISSSSPGRAIAPGSRSRAAPPRGSRGCGARAWPRAGRRRSRSSA